MLTFALILLLLMPVGVVGGREKTPQWWSLDLKGGAWLPRGEVMRDFVDCCKPTGMLEGGLLLNSKWGFELGVGMMDTDARAVGSGSGALSQDRLNFLVIPIANSFVFRADFRENQFLVPFAKVGPDYVFFRENLGGDVTKGVRYGLHGGAGLQILLEALDELSDYMESEIGVNDVYFTIEGRYAWIDNFGGSGLDLSHWVFSGGILFEF